MKACNPRGPSIYRCVNPVIGQIEVVRAFGVKSETGSELATPTLARISAAKARLSWLIRTRRHIDIKRRVWWRDLGKSRRQRKPPATRAIA